MSKQKQFMYTTCSELVVFMYCSGKSMNLLSYCGLVVARIIASAKDLPILFELTWHGAYRKLNIILENKLPHMLKLVKHAFYTICPFN